VAEDNRGNPEQTFFFADLAGYTALTEVHGDEEAVRLVEGYENTMRQLLPRYDAEAIKSIGDALLVRVPSAKKAVELGLQVTREVGSQHGFPAVRVGMHHGSAIERGGDYFGRTVNIAARVSALAGAGEVLATREVVDAAGDVGAVRFIDRGRHSLKGVDEPVAIYLVSSGAGRATDELPIDPVCRMVVHPERAGGMLVHEGTQHYFCSIDCARRFAEDPTRFV
jgi:class 3 adenylate cyclase